MKDVFVGTRNPPHSFWPLGRDLLWIRDCLYQTRYGVAQRDWPVVTRVLTLLAEGGGYARLPVLAVPHASDVDFVSLDAVASAFKAPIEGLPLEVGQTHIKTTLRHLLESGGVARWPYGDDHVTLLVLREEYREELVRQRIGGLRGA